ncbi:MAG: sulfotransferase domain-containing protein [Bacteroidota bacterium]
MNYRKRKRPPLWYVPILLTTAPRLIRAKNKGKYETAMRLGKKILGSPLVKKRAFGSYHTDHHDVFVCTYAKSGTYWTMQIVTQLANRGEGNFAHIHDWVPWPDFPVDDVVLLKEPTWQHTPTGKRAIKTHLEAEFVPYSDEASYLVIMRDPKDVILSSFYFSDSIIPGLSSIGIEAWLDAFINNKSPYGSWPEHIAGYWKWRDRANVEIFTFNQMKRNLAETIGKMDALIGTELSRTELEKVLARSEFSAMKAEEEKFLPPTPPGIDRSSLVLLRQGQSGEGKSVLSPEQCERVDRSMKDQLEALGSDFPYDSFFG